LTNQVRTQQATNQWDTSNQPAGITDGGNPTGDDYAYDPAGNLNKGTTRIEYNDLDLPRHLLKHNKNSVPVGHFDICNIVAFGCTFVSSVNQNTHEPVSITSSR
jgi:hypothetical protein